MYCNLLPILHKNHYIITRTTVSDINEVRIKISKLIDQGGTGGFYEFRSKFTESLINVRHRESPEQLRQLTSRVGYVQARFLRKTFSSITFRYPDLASPPNVERSVSVLWYLLHPGRRTSGHDVPTCVVVTV
jgi:hypothetical protein